MPESTTTVQLIVLEGLEGNSSVDLFPMQEWLYVYTPLIENIWWVLWSATLAYVIINHLAVPLIARMQSESRTTTE